MHEADKRRLAQLLEAREQQKQKIEIQIEECDKKVFRKAAKKSRKRYSLTQAAQILGVHRQTLYYWIKKGWITPKRDYRHYPIFAVLDIEFMIEWKNRIKFPVTSEEAKINSKL